MISNIIQCQKESEEKLNIQKMFDKSAFLREYFDISSEESMKRIKKILGKMFQKTPNIIKGITNGDEIFFSKVKIKRTYGKRYFIHYSTDYIVLLSKGIFNNIIPKNYIESYNQIYTETFESFMDSLINNPFFSDCLNQVLETIKNEDLILNSKNRK